MIMDKDQVNRLVNNSARNGKVSLEINTEDFKAGIPLKTGRAYTITIHKRQPALLFDIEIDPQTSSSIDDKYILYSTDNNQSYYKELTIKDDKIDNDDIISLEYSNILTEQNYSLEIDTGSQGYKYLVFDNIPYSELKQM